MYQNISLFNIQDYTLKISVNIGWINKAVETATTWGCGQETHLSSKPCN